MKIYLTLLISSLFSITLFGQITIPNPGFEGVPGTTDAVPPGFNICLNTPDIGPGMWGINFPPSQGNSYVFIGAAADGTTTGFVNTEAFGAQTSETLLAGCTYTFQIDVASMQGVTDGERWEGSLLIYGGTASCVQTELLFNTGPLAYNGPSGVCNNPREDGNWVTFTVTFTPTVNLDYLIFRHEGVANRVMCGTCCWDWGGASIGIDNMTDITIVATTPTFNTIGPLCVGDVAPVLPTTSNEGITGTWDAAVSTTSAGTTTYTFTPDAGQCASSTTMDVTVNVCTTPCNANAGTWN